jgi:Flp pilus assembly protein TadG
MKKAAFTKWPAMKSQKKLLLKSQKGQALVEMAFILPLLLMVLFGIIDFGRVFHAYLTLDHAGREGARLASLQGDNSDIQTRINSTATGLDTGKLIVSLDPIDKSKRLSGTDVTVKLTYTIDFLTPFINSLAKPITLTDTTVMRVE